MRQTLDYTIDILPTEAASRPVGQDRSAQIVYSDHFAAFRSPETAQAAQNASPQVKALLSEAGIALTNYSSGVPTGYYPQADEAAQSHLFECVLQAVDEEDSGRALPSKDQDFQLEEFLAALSSARPYGALVAAPSPLRPEPQKTQTKTPLTVAVAIGILSFSGAFFSYLI